MEGGKAHENNMKKVRQSFLLSHVLQDYCKDFLEDAKVRLIHKNNVLTPLSENIAGWQHLKLCNQMVWILRTTVSYLYVH